MSDPEVIHLLSATRQEIVSLRQQVAALQPRAEAWDVLARVVNLYPAASQGYGVDLVWSITNAIEALENPPVSKEETQ